ncbi:MAG: PrsW family glutamic-type intramembrane protease [bacterium]|nr:PrsW family glutamic-type intramembrane protease [bacterium]
MTFNLTTGFLILLALVPALGWVLVYRYLDSRDTEPFGGIFLALVLGGLSTIPVFGLQKIFAKYPHFDVVSLIQQTVSDPLVFTALFLVFVAVVEETVKATAFLICMRASEKSFNQVVDGIVYAAMVGIGFALTENYYYFSRAWDSFQLSGSFLAIFAIRSFGTMLAHTLFASVFGLYFGKAYFAPFIREDSKQEKLWQNLGSNLARAIRFHGTFLFLLPRIEGQHQSIKRNVMIMEGFFVTIFLHFLYNALIKLEVFGHNWTFLIIPLIFLMAWFVWSRFFVRIYNRVLEFVQVKTGWYRVNIR